MRAVMSELVVVIMCAMVIGTIASRGSLESDPQGDDEPRNPITSVVPLNRFMFDGNVVECRGNHTDHWIVLFCVPWYEPCQQMGPAFRETSAVLSSQMNSGSLLRSHVRFATVDCSTDKVLCNDNGVNDYPTVAHFNGGERMSHWTPNVQSDLARMGHWIEKQLNTAEIRRATPLSAGSQEQHQAEGGLPAVIVAIVALALAMVPVCIVVLGSDTGLPPPDRLDSSKKAYSRTSASCPVENASKSKVQRCMPEAWATRRGALVL